MLSCNHQFFSERITTQKRIFTWYHRKESSLLLRMILFSIFSQAVVSCLESKDYTQIRNTLILLTKVWDQPVDYTWYPIPSCTLPPIVKCAYVPKHKLFTERNTAVTKMAPIPLILISCGQTLNCYKFLFHYCTDTFLLWALLTHLKYVGILKNKLLFVTYSKYTDGACWGSLVMGYSTSMFSQRMYKICFFKCMSFI